MRRHAEGCMYEIYQGCSPCTISGNIRTPLNVILVPKAALFLVNTKNRDPWEGPTPEVRHCLE